jgi:hypothetical protein
MAVFLFLPFFVIFGVLLVFLPMDIADNSKKIVPLSIFLLGIFLLRGAIYIHTGCPWGEQTYSLCGTGQQYEVKNEFVIGFTSCADLYTSPFSSGVEVNQICQLFGCGLRQCLKQIEACGPDGGPSGMGDPVFECVAQVPMGSTNIESLFICIAIILLGLIAYFLCRRKASENKGSGGDYPMTTTAPKTETP